MTIAWVAGPEGYEFLVDAVPLDFRVGTHLIQGEPKPVPIIMVGYELEQVSFFVKIAKHARAHKTSPTMHFWNLETPRPDVALYFEISDPPEELIQDFHVPALEILFGAGIPKHCHRLRIGIAGAVHQENVRKFLASYQDHQLAMAVFVEAETEDPEGNMIPLAGVLSHTLLKIPFSMDMFG